jgi:hypothetical protein
MNLNNFDNPDAWIDEIRIKMHEDMQRLGQEEWHRQLGENVQKIVEEYGLTMVDRIPSTHISDELKQSVRKSAAAAASGAS